MQFSYYIYRAKFHYKYSGSPTQLSIMRIKRLGPITQPLNPKGKKCQLKDSPLESELDLASKISLGNWSILKFGLNFFEKEKEKNQKVEISKPRELNYIIVDNKETSEKKG